MMNVDLSFFLGGSVGQRDIKANLCDRVKKREMILFRNVLQMDGCSRAIFLKVVWVKLLKV